MFCILPIYLTTQNYFVVHNFRRSRKTGQIASFWYHAVNFRENQMSDKMQYMSREQRQAPAGFVNFHKNSKINASHPNKRNVPLFVVDSNVVNANMPIEDVLNNQRIEGDATMPKRYNTPHRTHVVKTRMTDEEYELFQARLSAYDISQAEFIRQAISKAAIHPIVTVSPINDQVLSAIGRLIGEFGKIGSNLNQIARTNQKPPPD